MTRPVGKCISVIIPVFDPLWLADNCIDSVLSYTDERGIKLISELVIVDNSAGNAWPIVAKYGQLMTEKGILLCYTRTRSNLMHVDSINLGLRMSSGSWILCFNDDIEIPRTQGGWLERMARVFADSVNCGAATLTLLHRDHTIYWIGNGADNEHIDLNRPYDFIPRGYYYGSPWSNMACLLVRRSTFDKIPFDGIDPNDGKRHNHYVADHFFGRKIRSVLKKENVVCRDTWIYHYNERLRNKASRRAQ